ncbi:phosphogluconate dehydratase [Sesbania bispinosa]|nr:phosphogluconate dehydratase [Sesbania bispinosa]
MGDKKQLNDEEGIMAIRVDDEEEEASLACLATNSKTVIHSRISKTVGVH